MDVMKCPNCGANIDSNECAYCKAKMKPPPNMSGAEMFQDIFMKSMAKNMEDYTKNGIPPSARPDPYFMEQFKKEHQAFHEKSEEEQKAIREKNRLARIAVENGKCPGCGTPFKSYGGFALSPNCKKCGESVYAFTYYDKF